jgi:hypothetical protein
MVVFVGNVVPHAPYRGLAPFQPAQDGVKRSVALVVCRVRVDTTLRRSPCERKKAQDAVLHLQRGKAPLNPFRMGYIKKPLQNGVKRSVVLVVCRVRVDTALRRSPCERKRAQDAVLHLQRGKAPLNPFRMGYIKKPLQNGVKRSVALVVCRVRVDTTLRRSPCERKKAQAI